MPPEADNTDKSHVNEIVEAIKGLLTAKGGDVTTVNDALIKDNFTLREQKRTLKTENAALLGKVPGDGTVVLKKEDAEKWAAFQTLGMDPEEIGTVLTEYDSLATEVVSTKAATALGWKPDVLRQQVEQQGLSIEMSEVEVEVKDKDGKATKVKKAMPFTTTADNKKVPLQEYEGLKSLTNSLVMDESDTGTGGRAQTGVRMPKTGSTAARQGDAEAPSTLVGAHMAARYPRPSQRGKATGSQ